MRVDARPAVGRGLTAVVEAGPDEPAFEKRPLVVELPPGLGGCGPGREVQIVGADVALLLIVFVNAARRDGAAGFRADGRLLRELSVEVVDQLLVVIEPLDVDDIGNALAPFAIHRHGDGARRIEAANQSLHGGDDALAAFGALLALLVAERPDEDARVIAVAEHQTLELAESLGIR